MTPIQLGSTFQVGRQHIQHMTPCQDVAIAVKDQSLIVLALSDGMGSCRHAELGARFVADFVRKNAREILATSDNRMKIFQRMQREAGEYADQLGVELDELHCTLSFAIIGPTKMVAGSIGDSPLYLKNAQGLIHVDGDAGNDPGGNITYSALEPNTLRNMKFFTGVSNDIHGILMMSDGCLGFQKEDSLSAMAEDFPAWFHDVVKGKVTAQDAVRKLVEEGYDDCSFSYYVNMRKGKGCC